MASAPQSGCPASGSLYDFSRMDMNKFYERHTKGWFAQRKAKILMDGLPKAVRSSVLRRSYLESLDTNKNGTVDVIENEHKASIYFDNTKNTLIYKMMDVTDANVNLPRRRILSFSPSVSIKPEDGLPQFLCVGLRPTAPLHRVIPLKAHLTSGTPLNGATAFRSMFEMLIQTLSLRVLKIYHKKNRERNDELDAEHVPPCVLLSSEMEFFDLKGSGGVYPVGVEVFGYIAICETTQIAIDIIHPENDLSKHSFDFITTNTVDRWKHVLSPESAANGIPIPLQILLSIFENEVKTWDKLFDILGYHMHWLVRFLTASREEGKLSGLLKRLKLSSLNHLLRNKLTS